MSEDNRIAPQLYQAKQTFVVETVPWNGDNFEEIFYHYNTFDPRTGKPLSEVSMSTLNQFDALDVTNDDGKTIRVRKGNWLARFVETGWFFELEAAIVEHLEPMHPATAIVRAQG